jgi:hypothetical protein
MLAEVGRCGPHDPARRRRMIRVGLEPDIFGLKSGTSSG